MNYSFRHQPSIFDVLRFACGFGGPLSCVVVCRMRTADDALTLNGGLKIVAGSGGCKFGCADGAAPTRCSRPVSVAAPAADL
jgi:hypothetical protein